MAKKNNQQTDVAAVKCAKSPRAAKILAAHAQQCSPPKGGATSPVRSAPAQSSPRTSPGLLAGHYAGCKWSEPPLPSALPLPPRHWMRQQQAPDIAQQLKVLLKVQA